MERSVYILNRLKKQERYRRYQRALHFAVKGFALGLLPLFIWLVLKTINLAPLPPITLWFFPGISFLIFLLGNAFIPIPILQISRQLDRENHLHELLTTTYELAESRSPNPYVALIQAQAEAILKKIPRPRFHFNLLEKLLPVILLLLLLPALLDFKLPFFINPDTDVYQQGEAMAELGEKLAQKAKEKELDSTLELVRELALLGNRLQRENIDKQEARRLMDALLERIEKQQRYLRRDQEAGFPNLEMEEDQAEKPSLSDLLKEEGVDPQLLKNLRKNPNELTQEQRDALEKITESYAQQQEGQIPESVMRLKQFLQQQDAQEQEMENLEEAGEQLSDSTERLGSDQKGSDRKQQPDSPQGGKGREGGAQEGEGNGETPQGKKAVSGIGKEAPPDQSTETGKAPSQGVGSERMELKGEISAQGELQTLMRNLPGEGFSQLTPQQMIRSFAKQAEEVIDQDAIPLPKREVVRKYFLKLGIISQDE